MVPLIPNRRNEWGTRQQSYEVYDLLSQRLSEQLAKWKQIVSSDIPAYNNLVKQQEIPAVKVTTPPAPGE
jgi:hypothetical protein